MQNGTSFINRQRFVVSSFELANDRPRIHEGYNPDAARSVDLQRSGDRIFVKWSIGIDVITRGNLHHDRGRNDASTLRPVACEVAIDADVGFGRSSSVIAGGYILRC